MARTRETVSDPKADKAVKFTRRPMERIHKIHSAIKEGRLPNCNTLAKELEVTSKTVQRDINFMRDSLRVPLCYDEKAHGYYYEDSVDNFPEFEVGAEEMAALFLARSALESIRGTELSDKLRDAFRKLTRSMSERVHLNWTDLDEAFSRKVPEMKAREAKLFGELAEAVVQQLEVGFHYRKLDADTAEVRMVQPLHLGEVDGGYYLIGMDTDRAALRTFALPRMSRLKVTDSRFVRPAGFDGRAHLRRSFGVWSVEGDQEPFLVRVRLKGYAARLAQERRWHPTQEVKVLNGKGTKVDVCFEAGALEEVVRWVLSFGSKASVKGPVELRKLVESEVKMMGG